MPTTGAQCVMEQLQSNRMGKSDLRDRASLIEHEIRPTPFRHLYAPRKRAPWSDRAVDLLILESRPSSGAHRGTKGYRCVTEGAPSFFKAIESIGGLLACLTI